MSIQKSFYQVLDVALLLETDSDPLLRLFERDYALFRAPSVDLDRLLTVSARLHDKQADPWLSIDNKLISLRNHPAPSIYAYQAILGALFKNIRDFLVLHAGVVARDGQALILAGVPGAGKTTLVLELLKRRFSFFSDDFCPINRESRLVHPFPRSVWSSAPSEQSTQKTVTGSPGEGMRGDKIPIWPDKLGAIVAKEPCRAKWLICLDSGDDSDHGCELEVWLNEGSEGEQLLLDVRRLKGVTVEGLNTGLCEWRIEYPIGRGITSEMKLLLKKYENAIWHVFRRDSVGPDFAREPVLSPIAPSEAAFCLLRDLKGAISPRAKGETCEPSPMQVFLCLSEILTDVSCYRLRVGRLQSMCDLILQLAGQQ